MAHTPIGLYEKFCGTKVCDVDQFCSKIHQQCEDCSKICGGTHNYDRDLCLQECQVYLYDVRYAKSADVQLIRDQQLILLIIVILVIALFLVVHGTQFIRWLRRRKCLLFNLGCLQKLKLKKQQDKSAEAKQTNIVAVAVKPGDVLENPHTESPKVRPKLNFNSTCVHGGGNPSIYSTSSSLQTTMTPISGRLPAEDTTLDFSYDNGGLILTPPVPERFHAPETTF